MRYRHLILFQVSLTFLFFLLPTPEARAERFFLDASRAEETLASLVRPRLYGDEWLNIIRGLRNDTYTIQQGDNLWQISSRQFGDPFLWRKLWQVNSFLSNPHDLDVGQILKYYRVGAEEDIPTIRVPVTRLIPAGSGGDLDSDSLVRPTLKNRFRPSMIVVRDDEVLGEISGAYTVKSMLGELDELYLDLYNAEQVRIGERFAVVRIDKDLQDVGGDDLGGELVRLVGEVEVSALGESLAKAQLVSQFGLVSRGDRLVELQKVVEWNAFFNPPDDLTARVVIGEMVYKKIYGQGDLVLLNKGAADGMRPGQVFRVFRDMDPLTKSRWDVEPDFKGEIQVVYTKEVASIGYILRNKTPIFVGDTIIPSQLFPDPPPPPRRTYTSINIE